MWVKENNTRHYGHLTEGLRTTAKLSYSLNLVQIVQFQHPT